jgi:hypothetical protein
MLHLRATGQVRILVAVYDTKQYRSLLMFVSAAMCIASFFRQMKNLSKKTLIPRRTIC